MRPRQRAGSQVLETFNGDSLDRTDHARLSNSQKEPTRPGTIDGQLEHFLRVAETTPRAKVYKDPRMADAIETYRRRFAN
jgi:hypothetical protein